MRVSSCSTVLFVNNYETAANREQWQKDEVPGHHLWGTTHLSEDLFTVEDLDVRPKDQRPWWVNKANAALRRTPWSGKLGDLDLEAQIWSARGRGRPIVYTGNLNPTQLVALSRRAHLLSCPVVGVCLHVSDSPTWIRVNTLRGYDHLVSISTYLSDRLLEVGVPREKITTLGWGPDLGFSGFANVPPPPEDAPIVSMGKTSRDISTLLSAIARTGHKAQVWAQPSDLKGSPPDSVEIVDHVDSYQHALSYLQGAAVVTIPLYDDRLTGPTEMGEAVACGRPVIATRTRFFDVDIEEIGCGWWVEPGDVDGWCDRLNMALSDRDRLNEMGARGRRWAEKNWNMDLFGEGVNRVMTQVRQETGR